MPSLVLPLSGNEFFTLIDTAKKNNDIFILFSTRSLHEELLSSVILPASSRVMYQYCNATHGLLPYLQTGDYKEDTYRGAHLKKTIESIISLAQENTTKKIHMVFSCRTGSRTKKIATLLDTDFGIHNFFNGQSRDNFKNLFLYELSAGLGLDNNGLQKTHTEYIKGNANIKEPQAIVDVATSTKKYTFPSHVLETSSMADLSKMLKEERSL